MHTIHLILAPLLLLLLVAGAGCDIDGEQDYGPPDPPAATPPPPPPATAPSPMRIQAACEAYATAFCTRMDTCSEASSSVETCVVQETRDCVGDFAGKSAQCQSAYASALEGRCTSDVAKESCSTLCRTTDSGFVFCSDLCIYFC